MAESTQQPPLPDYDNPPVVEMVVGVQFERLRGFKTAHLGAFWKTLDGGEWPSVVDVPPLSRQFERFGEAGRWRKGIELRLTQDPTFRVQIKNKQGDRMIQVQNGRFHLNWLGEGGGKYPKYEKVRAEFESYVRRFIAFVKAENVGEFRANQWEVTYLNHIPKGTVWNTPSDWSFFQPLDRTQSLPGLIQSEGFDGEWHYVIPPERGRLHVQWQHGIKSGAEEHEIIVLTFTARGPLAEDGDQSAILQGLDLGHEVIVRSFGSLMSDRANKFWKRKQ
jgi:uncharacterized protein (TIGR04255 family)